MIKLRKNPQEKKTQNKTKTPTQKNPLKLRLQNEVTGMINTLKSIHNLNVAYL